MDFSLYYILYFVILVAVCVKILLDTKSPSKATAHIALVIFFPIVGMILYFAIGINYRKRKLYHKKLNFNKSVFPELRDKVTKYSMNEITSNANKLDYFYPLAQFCGKESLSSDNNKVTLLINGEEKFPAMIDAIKAAKHHIHIEYYIYEDDDIGTTLANLLIQKAKEGIKIRFIYDDFGSKTIRKEFVNQMQKAGIEAVPFYKITFIHFANRLNYRNHRKILVVDGIVGFVGGINVADDYYNNGKKSLFWRDTHIKIEGESVLNLQHIFLTDWNFCAQQEIQFSQDYFPLTINDSSFGDQFVQITASGPDSEHPSIMYKLLQMILLAKEEVLIATPYFIPEKSFLDALKIAKLSGVNIKIIIPDKSDSSFVNAACKSYYQELLEIGIEVYQYQKGFIHSKIMICDTFVSVVGTANLDNRSFDLNFEVNAVIYDKSFSKEMKINFEKDILDSKKIILAEWISRPISHKVIEKVCQLFSPIL